MSTKNQKTVTEVAIELGDATNSDGTVDVEVNEVIYHENSEKIAVKFFTPLGKSKTETFDKPERVDTSYEAVQFAESYIGSFEAIKQLEGMTVRADPDSWEIQVPDSKSVSIAKGIASCIKPFVTGALIIIEILLVLTALGGAIGFILLPLAGVYSTLSTVSEPVLSVSVLDWAWMVAGSIFITYISVKLGDSLFDWNEF